jgi:16S rRNA C1402 (ribose-2'-O) methylase RsmI
MPAGCNGICAGAGKQWLTHQPVLFRRIFATEGDKHCLKHWLRKSARWSFTNHPCVELETLKDLMVVFGEDRPCSVSRELSKKFEETIRGVWRRFVHISRKERKGEIVLVVNGKEFEKGGEKQIANVHIFAINLKT